MLGETRPDLVIAFPGGPVAADLIARAEVAAIPVLKTGSQPAFAMHWLAKSRCVSSLFFLPPISAATPTPWPPISRRVESRAPRDWRGPLSYALRSRRLKMGGRRHDRRHHRHAHASTATSAWCGLRFVRQHVGFRLKHIFTNETETCLRGNSTDTRALHSPPITSTGRHCRRT